MAHTKWTYETVCEVFRDRGCELLETEYKNSSTKLRYKAKCGHEHSITFNNFLSGKGDLCRACRIKSNAEKESRLDSSGLEEELKENGCVLISRLPTKWKDTFDYIAQCGHVNTISYAHWHCGSGRLCPTCSKSIKYSEDFVRSVFRSKGCELLSDYTNCKSDIKFKAPNGKIGVTTFDKFLNGRNTRDRESGIPAWRDIVFARDNYTCDVCGRRGVDLEAHHIASYADNKEERLNVDNGITLCKECHREFHKAYGFGKNNIAQFDSWKREYRGKYAVKIA